MFNSQERASFSYLAFSGYLQRLCSENTREEVIDKLSIRLVSNQPAADNLQTALSNAQKLKTNAVSTQIQTAQLLKQLPAQDQDVIKALQGGTGLTSGQFTDFLRILDLSSCEKSTAFQRCV